MAIANRFIYNAQTLEDGVGVAHGRLHPPRERMLAIVARAPNGDDPIRQRKEMRMAKGRGV